MTIDPTRDFSAPIVTDELASAEQIAGYPHSRLCRAALDAPAEHIRSAEKLLRALDDVLDPKQSEAGRDLSTRHLQQRVERELQALKQAS